MKQKLVVVVIVVVAVLVGLFATNQPQKPNLKQQEQIKTGV